MAVAHLLAPVLVARLWRRSTRNFAFDGVALPTMPFSSEAPFLPEGDGKSLNAEAAERLKLSVLSVFPGVSW